MGDHWVGAFGVKMAQVIGKLGKWKDLPDMVYSHWCGFESLENVPVD